MKVKAKFAAGKFGFYGDRRRYDGDEFEIQSKAHFSKIWMDSLEKPKPRKAVEKADKGEGAL